MLTRAVKGTKDVLPNQSYIFQYIESAMLKIAGKFGYKEIRTPVFEHTELFTRGVGDTTDVVQKEMYTFPDKGGRSITLRPEGTAGAVRAFIEHGLFNEAMPQKICYLTSCYRYEKPQAGRLREFHQFGVECLGSAEPAADAEVISLADEIFNFLGVKNLRLELNTIGCPVCRPDYHEALRKYFEKNREELCPTCLDRLSRNPMRILDCKSSICSKIAANAPVMLEHICPECSAHFESVKEYLGVMGIDFTLNPRIVRGLDYYTRTVFEFISSEIGAQGTVCGGGRYDGLVETLGGPAVPSLGFGLGIERLLLLMEKQQTPLPEDENCEIFLVTIGKPAQLKAANLARALREEGISAQVDLVGRSVKAQMKYADKICAGHTLVLGDDELAKGEAVLRDMENGNTIIVSLSNFTEDITKAIMERAEENLRKVFEQT